MRNDTDIEGGGGGGGRFPSTRRSAVLGARSADPAERERSLETLSVAYWKPVYLHVRARWGRSDEDAKDLAQGFFLRALQKNVFSGYDPAKGRFRTFLRACLDGYLANEHEAARAQKRGGGAVHVSIEPGGGGGDGEDGARGGIAAESMSADALGSGVSLDRAFETEWVRGLFELAVARLRGECEAKGRQSAYRTFERYDLEDAGEGLVTYESLASELGIPVTTVTNHLALARRELRRILLETLREITASEEEFRLEARTVLGKDPG